VNRKKTRLGHHQKGFSSSSSRPATLSLYDGQKEGEGRIFKKKGGQSTGLRKKRKMASRQQSDQRNDQPNEDASRIVFKRKSENNRTDIL
jgi:hypothetical protein